MSCFYNNNIHKYSTFVKTKIRKKMLFKKTPPSDRLKNYIECYWIAQEDGSKMIREINPSSNICVQFHIDHDANYKLITKDFSEGKKQTVDLLMKEIGVNPTTARNVIIGPHRTMMIETSENTINTFCIKFKTGIRKRFFGKEIISLTDNIIQLDNTNTLLSGLANIVSQCNTDEIFDIVDKFLTEKYWPIISRKAENDSLLDVINETTLNPLCANVESMAAQMNMSKRNFERLFKQFIGLTPKQFIVIQRINKVIECMKGHKDNTLTEILEMSGYYDQTHINHEFNTIGGLPATQVLNNFRKQLVDSPDTLCLNFEIDGVCGFNTLT